MVVLVVLALCIDPGAESFIFLRLGGPTGLPIDLVGEMLKLDFLAICKGMIPNEGLLLLPRLAPKMSEPVLLSLMSLKEFLILLLLSICSFSSSFNYSGTLTY